MEVGGGFFGNVGGGQAEALFFPVLGVVDSLTGDVFDEVLGVGSVYGAC